MILLLLREHAPMEIEFYQFFSLLIQPCLLIPALSEKSKYCFQAYKSGGVMADYTQFCKVNDSRENLLTGLLNEITHSFLS